ncbi:sugar phosphate isomerase/epimerase family protein [Paenibacillus qinlingensis]|uniref:sugar phosphate isomerase/epimerase family protein n=1 Tax=Paenibacillus qinlingensis TaxID=1837343 RepID=UPI001566312F|nr:TIM barrel protein [Paenibacillus qinlingensis]NQX58671.1 TIM barrel protein [Paenibacillus qinlingensis]
MILPGLVSVTFRERSAIEILELSSHCGLKAIEWSENAHVQPGDAAGAHNLYARTIDSGMQIAAYGSYFRLLVNQQPEQVFRESLIAAKALHAPLIRIWAGTVPSSAASSDYYARIAQEAKLIAEMAAAEGIKVALEWHRGTLTDTNQSSMRLLEEADHANLFCLWQPTPELSVKERCEGLHELAERKKLLNLHAYYWEGDIRRPFAEGIHEWSQYLAQIDSREDRYMLMEFVMGNTVEQFKSDVAAIQQLLNELS